MLGHRLNAALTVYRATFAADGAGGRTSTLATVGSIRAQVSQATAAEREIAQRMGADLAYVVHTTSDADVERGDELEHDGTRFRVLAILRNSRTTYTRLECEVIQGG